jgi:5,10-methylenetetrahydromethanopterin reductase
VTADLATYGIMFRREWPVERLVDIARAAESHGFDELWIVEDLGFHGGFTQATAALAATERIHIGIGIAPAVVRNAAYAAMEIATLAQMFPGRLHMGFGHGVDVWIQQVGAVPVSWIAALGEVVVAAKQLLNGNTVTTHGKHVHLDAVRLEHPPAIVPPISLGVRGPHSMQLAADVADGIIFAEWSGPRYVQQVREQIGAGTKITVFVQASADVAALDSMLAEKLALSQFESQMAAYEGETPTLPELAISGDPSTWRDQAQRWVDVGADAVVYCPLPADPVGIPQ